MTAGEVAAVAGLDRGAVSTTLARLASSGEVIKAPRRYRLPAAGAGEGAAVVAEPGA